MYWPFYYWTFWKSFMFFPGWICHFKGLFIPVWREIHRSKILPVTSWQLTNRTLSDISYPSRHSICQSFFPAWIYNMIQIHSGETSRPRDFVALAQSLRHLMHWSSLRSLLRTYERSTCSKPILLPILVEVIFTVVICRHCRLVLY